MARIKMPAARSTAKEITFEEAFHIFLTDSAARGLAEKTLKTYRNHLHCISLYFDISTPLGKLSRNKMNEMVVSMRESGLATNSISSYVQVTTTFLNWCKREMWSGCISLTCGRNWQPCMRISGSRPHAIRDILWRR